MNYKISVIVPVYNAEKYLELCIQSICNQTYENIEIILVNDGSTDGSLSICKHYVKKDSRIKLINQENSGSSIARNTGLDNATGNIISFVDSDDYIKEHMFETMLNLMITHKLDVVEIERNAKSDHKRFDNSFIIENQVEAAERIIKTTAFQVWKRIYKRSLINDMRFIPNIIHQDAFYTIDVLNRINKIGFLNSPLYHYNRESIGIIRSQYSAMKRDISVKVIEYIKDNIPMNEKVQQALDIHIVNYYTDHFMMISRAKEFDENGDHRRKLKREIKKSLHKSTLNLRAAMVVLLPLRAVELLSTYLKKFRTG